MQQNGLNSTSEMLRTCLAHVKNTDTALTFQGPELGGSEFNSMKPFSRAGDSPRRNVSS